MVIKLKFLKNSVILLVLLGFVFPLKTPVSSAEAKMCCKSKGHCLMGKESGTKISAMGKSVGAKMIACCQDDCPSCSETSILHSRVHLSSHNLGLYPASAIIVSLDANHFLLATGPPFLGRSDLKKITGFPSPPIFQRNSTFLI